MNTIAVDRKQTAFRLRTDLLDRLKVAAKKENRSLNNYVESVLLDAVYREPNEETLTAMKEAKENGNLETLDLDNFEKYVDSLK
ncbi:MAG: toxin-antitoxin system protein [Bacteroidales bacterium]